MAQAGPQLLFGCVACLSHLIFLFLVFLDAKMGTEMRTVRSLLLEVGIRWLLGQQNIVPEATPRLGGCRQHPVLQGLWMSSATVTH